MTPTSVTSVTGTSICATLLRDVSRRLTHEVNNAANGVAVNLEVARSRTAESDPPHPAAPFALRASEQLEGLTALQEMLRSLLALTIESLNEEKLSCRLSESGESFEVTFAGAVIPRGLRVERDDRPTISLRNSPEGVILSVPRNSPSSE